MKSLTTSLLILMLLAGEAIGAGDLMVRGNLGIGTTTPDAKLDVRGGVKIGGADAVCGAATEGMVRYNSTAKRAEFCDGEGWMLVGNETLIDVTDRSTDYPLKAGETAKITFTSATSIPLHIGTSEGLYELLWVQPYTTSLSSDGGVGLRPNNATVSAGSIVFSENRQDYSPTVSGGGGAGAYWRDGNMTSFSMGYNYTLFARFTISTFTNSKHILGEIHRISTPSSPLLQSYSIFETWKDTSTVWSSFGTVVLPYAQSGTIIIKRIL